MSGQSGQHNLRFSPTTGLNECDRDVTPTSASGSLPTAGADAYGLLAIPSNWRFGMLFWIVVDRDWIGLLRPFQRDRLGSTAALLRSDSAG
jgi:hypothetical protein